MKDSYSNLICVLAGVAIGLAVCVIISLISGNHELPHKTYRVDSITYVDTIKHDSVITRDSTIVRYKVIPIAREDTSASARADTVLLPVTQKHYSSIDYDAWVSGYEPQLDSIRTYSRRSILMLPPAVRTDKNKRFGIGIQAGYGVGRDGLTPYIGVGVSYMLLGL